MIILEFYTIDFIKIVISNQLKFNENNNIDFLKKYCPKSQKFLEVLPFAYLCLYVIVR